MAEDNVLPVLTFLYRIGWTAARPIAAPLTLVGGKLGRAIRGRRASVSARHGKRGPLSAARWSFGPRGESIALLNTTGC